MGEDDYLQKNTFKHLINTGFDKNVSLIEYSPQKVKSEENINIPMLIIIIERLGLFKKGLS